jgi:hypothetical protein
MDWRCCLAGYDVGCVFIVMVEIGFELESVVAIASMVLTMLE